MPPHHASAVCLSALLVLLSLSACVAESDAPTDLEGDAQAAAALPSPGDRTCGDYLDSPEQETYHRLDGANQQLLHELGDCLRELCFQECSTSDASCWQCGELSCPEQMAACDEG